MEEANCRLFSTSEVAFPSQQPCTSPGKQAFDLPGPWCITPKEKHDHAREVLQSQTELRGFIIRSSTPLSPLAALSVLFFFSCYSSHKQYNNSYHRFHHFILQGIVVSQEVEAALREGRPVVALESTIISHGMPFPQNLTTAEAVEAVVRENGCVPATVAVIQGRPHVGLTPELLQHIAQRLDSNPWLFHDRPDMKHALSPCLKSPSVYHEE